MKPNINFARSFLGLLGLLVKLKIVMRFVFLQEKKRCETYNTKCTSARIGKTGCLLEIVEWLQLSLKDVADQQHTKD